MNPKDTCIPSLKTCVYNYITYVIGNIFFSVRFLIRKNQNSKKKHYLSNNHRLQTAFHYPPNPLTTSPGPGDYLL